MKVLDLRCSNQHRFEGWFASDEAFADQHTRGLLECPLCADRSVSRLPSAPRLNLSGAREPAAAAGGVVATGGQAQAHAQAASASAPAPDASVVAQAMQAQWLQAVRQALARTEDVGERFADEARRIHYGEAESRGIRGVTSAQEREALRDEGIEVLSIPVPPSLKEPLQ
jgi:hypothetical protein